MKLLSDKVYHDPDESVTSHFNLAGATPQVYDRIATVVDDTSDPMLCHWEPELKEALEGQIT